MYQTLPTNTEELNAFRPANKVSEDNKKLWAELWEKGMYVQPIGQIHVGEIDYLIVTCHPPSPEARQVFAGTPN